MELLDKLNWDTLLNAIESTSRKIDNIIEAISCSNFKWFTTLRSL
jgi:hypothetical protein